MNNFMMKLVVDMIAKMNLHNILFMVYKNLGRDALERFVTPPQSLVEKLGNKKVPLAVQLEERDEFVEELKEFLESLTDENFVDPD